MMSHRLSVMTKVGGFRSFYQKIVNLFWLPFVYLAHLVYPLLIQIYYSLPLDSLITLPNLPTPRQQLFWVILFDFDIECCFVGHSSVLDCFLPLLARVHMRMLVPMSMRFCIAHSRVLFQTRSLGRSVWAYAFEPARLLSIQSWHFNYLFRRPDSYL